MSLFDALRYRLRALSHPGEHAHDREEEMRHHLALGQRDARGADGAPLSPTSARHAAKRELGNTTYMAEERRMISGLAAFDSIGQDITFVSRLLRRRATFSIVTVVTLALGLGAATSLYSVADAVLFRPLPFPDPSRLTTVWLERPSWKLIPGLERRWNRGELSLPLFRDWRRAQTSFDDVAAWTLSSAIVGGANAGEEVATAYSTASLARVLGIRPALGTWFSDRDDQVGGAAVTVMGFETWNARFGADPRIVGKTVIINDTSYTVVGVAPRGLSINRGATLVAYWLPAGRTSDAIDKTSYDYAALGRLRATVALSAASAETERIVRARRDDDHIQGAALATLQDDQTRLVRRPLLILLAASGLLLLIACINVATLLLGESASRQAELRTRAAIGASRPRLLRQLLTESVILAGVGAVAGVGIAYVATRLIVRAAPPSIPGLGDVQVNGRVLAVGLVVAIATGILFGLAPAVSLARSSQSFGVGTRTMTRGSGRGQRLLIGCEVALSMVLLVSAGLLVRSFDKLSSVGFNPDHLVVATIRLPQAPFDDSVHVRAVYQAIVERLAASPLVKSVAATTLPPFQGGTSSTNFEVEGRAVAPGQPRPSAHRRAATPEFFSTLGIAMVEGHAYTARDGADRLPVIVVSNELARAQWPHESAVGKRIKIANEWRTIVGVTDDIETERPTGEPPQIVYMPFAQVMLRAVPAVVVRTRDDATQASAAIRGLIESVEGDVKVTRVDAMSALVSKALADDRLRVVLISLFACIAAVLAAIGTYGVSAAATERRTREMAIRVAVGATGGSVTRLIIRGVATGVAGGGIVGIGLALAGTRTLAAYVYGVQLTDATVYASVLAFLALITTAASWIPARRAARVRVVETLASD